MLLLAVALLWQGRFDDVPIPAGAAGILVAELQIDGAHGAQAAPIAKRAAEDRSASSPPDQQGLPIWAAALAVALPVDDIALQRSPPVRHALWQNQSPRAPPFA
ncbi:MAG: hypothetical protein Q7J57_15855 [Gemmobacter sp.]|nr:hypothetical protein [Gemmobacter sp.]